MRPDVLVVGGAAALLFFLSRKGEEGGEAAEGFIRSPLEYVKEEVGLGIGVKDDGGFAVSNFTGKSSGGVVSTLSEVQDLSYAERQAYYEAMGLDSREAMKAALDPGYYDRVTGAGYEWTKAGRYQEKQDSKMEDRYAAAERLGLTYEEYMARNEGGKYAAGSEETGEGYYFDPNTGYLGPDTKVYTEEDLAQPGMEKVKAIFDKLMGIEPEPSPFHPELTESGSHLATEVIDWSKTLGGSYG